MELKAVLTGDIIKSKEIGEKSFLLKVLEQIFNELEKRFSFDNPFEIYRGDSFQALLKKPNEALRIAFLVRLGLIKGNQWDARIGIGVEGVSFRQKDVKISNGKAFEFSGMMLDQIKDGNQRIRIKTLKTTLDKPLDVMCGLADAISKRWSQKTAEVLYLHLLYDKTQREISKELKISQSAVQQRMAAADFNAINMYIRYFEELNFNSSEL